MLMPNQVVSLWDMLELNAPSFLGAATQIATMRQMLSGIHAQVDGPVGPEAAVGALTNLEALRSELLKVGARLACVSTDRLMNALAQTPTSVTLLKLKEDLRDVESRFADHLAFIKMFVIHESNAYLLSDAHSLLTPSVASLYPSLMYDCEEAAKCLCFSRPTACVFHTMRMLEVGINALAKRLSIPDPVKAAERNWGKILESIKGKIDEMHPASRRMPGSEGSMLAELYASLDAIKHPWRNATMHVESIYTEEEARHILNCSAILIQKMASMFDENGLDADAPSLVTDGT